LRVDERVGGTQDALEPRADLFIARYGMHAYLSGGRGQISRRGSSWLLWFSRFANRFLRYDR
jgi:hypothetical protein